MTQAERTITLEYLAWLKEEAARANSSYDAARKAYKRQQKASNQVTRQIKELLDAIEDADEHPSGPPS